MLQINIGIASSVCYPSLFALSYGWQL